MLFHDIFAHHPKEREAIIDQDRSVTYGEFQDLVERWAAYFEALGVKRGTVSALSARTAWNSLSPILLSSRLAASSFPLIFSWCRGRLPISSRIQQ